MPLTPSMMPRAGTATITDVTSATSSTQLLAANRNRVGAVIYNDSTAILRVKFGTAAATASFTAEVPAEGQFPIPGLLGAVYTGVVHGIWDAANGAARVTELTA